MRTNNLGTKKQNQAGYTHTKVYNNETTFKTTLLQESLNIYNNKKLLQKQVKEPKRYGECNCRKMLTSRKPYMSLICSLENSSWQTKYNLEQIFKISQFHSPLQIT